MNTVEPPTEGVKTPPAYGPKASPGTRPEAGGFTVTCVCKWLRWFADESATTEGRREHEKKCKGEAVAPDPAPSRLPRSRGKR